MVDMGRPFYDQDGEFAGYIGSCYDMTDRKQAEEISSLLARSRQLEPIVNTGARLWHFCGREVMPVAFVSDNNVLTSSATTTRILQADG